MPALEADRTSDAARRVLFVAPRESFDVVSPRLTAEFREEGLLHSDERVSVLRRYAVTFGGSEPGPEQWDRAVAAVFADPADERIVTHPEDVLSPDGGQDGAPRSIVSLAVRYHREQFDQRADAAEQALRLVGIDGARVTVAEVYVARLRPGDKDVIAERRRELIARVVNPVDSELVEDDDAAGSAGERAAGDVAAAAPAADVPPAETAEGSLEGTALNAADRTFVAEFFASQDRAPTATELAVIDTYWSDHCRHTTFRTRLDSVTVATQAGDADARSDTTHTDDADAAAIRRAVEESWSWYLAERERRGETDRPVTLMDLATAMMRWRRSDGTIPEVEFSAEINACTVRISATTPGLAEPMAEAAPWLVLFKNETHNHPTEIEPYGGAATCLGGAIRDPLSGRALVYQAMRVSGAADPRREPGTPTLPGKLPQRRITTGAARGYSSYGNQIGVATGLVDEVYHPGYRAKRLEMGAVVGAVPAGQVRREEPVAGDVVLLIGGRTGRDGIGGATGSSRSHSRSSLERAGAEVQKGNPPVERALQRLFSRREFAALVKRSNDFGAGGVAVAVGEIADGVEIDLDAVPLKYAGLSPTEIAISESQERMAVVVAAADREATIALAAQENLEATAIARVTAEDRLVMVTGGQRVVDLPRAFVDSAGVRGTTDVELATVRSDRVGTATGSVVAPAGATVGDLAGSAGGQTAAPGVLERLRRQLGDLRFASRLSLSEWFDSSIGAGTLLAHAGGRLQRSPVPAMAARLPHRFAGAGDTPPEVATVMAYGFDPDTATASPWRGAYLAVVESVARLAAAGVAPGAIWLSLQEYFPRPGTDPGRWGLPAAALLGALAAQRDLGVTAIGGKDSMSGSFEEIDVPPTLISVALGVCPADGVVPPHLTAPEASVYLVPVPMRPEGVPDAVAVTAAHRWLHDGVASGVITAAAPVRGAGWLATVAQMCFGENLGFEADPLHVERAPDPFTAGYGTIVFATDGSLPDVTDDGPGAGGASNGSGGVPRPPVVRIGVTTADGVIRWGREHGRTADLFRVWSAPLEEVFPSQPARRSGAASAVERERSSSTTTPASTTAAGAVVRPRRPSRSVAVPRVVLPVFPGTNCEDDSTAVWRQAGAEVREVLIRTGSREVLEDSLATLARELRDGQILMLPGGFSAGDEPAGSGKYIAAALRAPVVRETVERHFVDGDRLILGICNGFQALVRTGLVPYGRYVDRVPGAPSLAPNTIGRHVSRTVLTRIDADRGPWMAQATVGEIVSVPVSHGEGRFTADASLVADLSRAGQVAARYVDWQGRPRQDHPWNPNGSDDAIEALLSPDGRFLGKMGHTERERPGLARHLPSVGSWDLWRAGVAWFA